MRRVLRGFFFPLALLALAVLPGCEFRMLKVVIPDFESAQVEGVQVFRLDDATGLPVAVGELRFERTFVDEQGRELLEYGLTTRDGEEISGLISSLQRDGANTDQAQVVLFFERDLSGWYKVATFNQAGASKLSAAQTFF